MGKYILTDAADADLDSIGRYTRDSFGMAQAARYLTDLKSAFIMLGDRPDAGRPRQDIASGLRSFRKASHLIFYRINEISEVEVLRVLHHAQDAESILPD